MSVHDSSRGVRKSAHFTQVDEEVKVSGRVVDFVDVTIKDADGNEYERDVVRHPGAVAIVAIDNDSNVYLVRQYRTPIDGDVWEIPAGKRDVAGEDPKLTGIRELEEEAGLLAKSFEPLIGVYHSAGFSDEYCDIFLATDLTEVPQKLEGPEEAVMELKKFALAETIEMIFQREITDAKSVAGLFAAYNQLLA